MGPSALPQVLSVKSLVGIASSIMLGVWLAGCAPAEVRPPVVTDGADPTTVSATPDTDGKKKVLTTFTILADMAQNVAGDKLAVASITRIGAEIHGYEPTPSDLTKAQDADLILYNGMELERWFEQFLGNLQDVPSVLLTEGIQPVPIAAGPYGGQAQSPCLDVAPKCFDLCAEYSQCLCGA